jgi:hypothetical protein
MSGLDWPEFRAGSGGGSGIRAGAIWWISGAQWTDQCRDFLDINKLIFL